MIRADGSDDGQGDPAPLFSGSGIDLDSVANTVGITIDQDGWARVNRGGVTFQVPREVSSGWAHPDRELQYLAGLTEAMTRPIAAEAPLVAGGGNYGGGYVPPLWPYGGINDGPDRDVVVSGTGLTLDTAEVTINATNVSPVLMSALAGNQAQEQWRTRDCGDECSQQGSGSVYHYEEAELSNGDIIEINYRISPNQQTHLLSDTGLLHSYLRQIVDRERLSAEEHLVDREMIRRRTGR